MKLEVTTVSHEGRLRKKNEDSFYISDDSEQEGMFAVFDGMGGIPNGHIASAKARDFLKELYEKEQFADLSEYLLQINQKICEHIRENEQKMGSTAVLLRLSDTGYELANLGDSRGYLIRDGDMIQLSKDHTEAEFMKRLQVQSETAGSWKNILTQYLGIDEADFAIEPYLTSGLIYAGDIFLLCSDGLSAFVSNEEMVKIAVDTHRDMREKTDQLLEAALDQGGNDNITVILIKVENI